ncbi:hypothetical protein RI543_001818 [Arxiozyma heterogenica]|uniref:Uncharacterized protein n=1 Tax=Arxiozyma heterogenica TaxID=278026 RepID=A0AAN7W403_9SACH|nr:hypothetical protein RI543_001818 [Kazachstania heterogenica]
MEITGYYKALLTGIYTITTKLNDSATILVGAGVAFDCGNQHKNFIAKKFSLTGSGVNKIPGPGLTAYTSITSTKNAALLSLSGATTTSTSLSTSAIHSYNEKVVVVYYVTTQISVAATTTYIPGLLKTTSTVSIYTSYTTDSNGSSSPIDIVVVMTPDVVTTSLRRYYRNSSTISTESLLSYFRMGETEADLSTGTIINTQKTATYEASGSSTENMINIAKVIVTQESLNASPQTTRTSGRLNTVTLSQYEASAPNAAFKWPGFMLELFSILPLII